MTPTLSRTTFTSILRMTLLVVVLNSAIIDSCVSGVGVADLNVEEEGGGGGEEPGAQGEAAQIALDGQALPPLQDIY